MWPPQRRMRLVSVRPKHKGTHLAFATIELGIGLRLVDLPIFAGNDGSALVVLPSKPQIGQDGRQNTDVNGKAQYTPVLSWRDRDLSDRFSTAVVELVRQGHPDARSDSP